jgi:hypothetical protein
MEIWVQIVSTGELLPGFINLREVEQIMGEDYNHDPEGDFGSRKKSLSEA